MSLLQKDLSRGYTRYEGGHIYNDLSVLDDRRTPMKEICMNTCYCPWRFGRKSESEGP